ncbi:MAG: hypothetical protein PWP04_1540 [Candidatus Atribacteria bacterium]|nr:hypothetical protein [Candidatus Atribacteria bacterium]
MRVDQFLKNSRLIKRRTLAQTACNSGKVLVNGKVAKPSTPVKVDDFLTISFPAYVLEVQIKEIARGVSPEGMYQVLKKEKKGEDL